MYFFYLTILWIYSLLLFYDAGIKQERECDDHVTGESNIYGIRWKCVVCEDTDRCTQCYMNTITNQCLDHPHVKYITPLSTV